MGIEIKVDGRRLYLAGDTYAARAEIKAAGGHWDGDRKAWWLGTGKLAEAERIASSATAPTPCASPSTTGTSGADPKFDALDRNAPLAGKAQYKGKPYLLVWEGTTSRGQACKLAFRDGSKVFWADAAEVTILKRYRQPDRSDRRDRTRAVTLASLEKFRDECASGARDDAGHRPGQRYECQECGEYVTAGSGSCWETGAAH